MRYGDAQIDLKGINRTKDELKQSVESIRRSLKEAERTQEASKQIEGKRQSLNTAVEKVQAKQTDDSDPDLEALVEGFGDIPIGLESL